MDILSTILIILSFSLISIIFYMFAWGFSRHIFKKIYIYYQLFLGVIFGFLSTFIVAIISIITADKKVLYLTLFLPIISYWVSIIFISWYASIGIITWNLLNLLLFSSLFSQYFGILDENYSKTLVSILYILPFIGSILKYYLFKKLSSWYICTVVIFIAFLIVLIWNIIYSNFSEIKDKSLYVILVLIALYLTYLICQTIDKIYIHALKLQNIVVYENQYYLNYSSSNSQILNLISQEKVRYGIYSNFYIAEFDKLEKKVSNNIKDYIFNSIATSAYKSISEKFKKVIFFKTNYKTFGVFIPIENLSNDIKKTPELTKLFNTLISLQTIFLIKSYKIKINIRSVSSFYGVHSNDLNNLNDLNNYMIKNQLLIIEESHTIANPSEILIEKNKLRKISSLNEVVNLNLHTTLYEPIYNLEKKDFSGYFLNGIINGEELNSQTFYKTKKLIDDMGLTSLFLRYLSLSSLKDYSRKIGTDKFDKLIFVNYDSDYLSSSSFDKDEFILKLKNLKINLKNLVLNFEINKEINSKATLKNNIMFLKSNNIKTSISNFGNELTDYSLIQCYEPDFIFLESELSKSAQAIDNHKKVIEGLITIAKKIEALLIATNVNSYIIYKRLKEIGLKNFLGSLMGSSSDLKKYISEELNYLLTK
ncbi:hypothetical protein SLITO_v1c00690 [Spiroplasma litorale]|uniref:EAL domain-containing protein n=1 Tax=Spiroplasma litorale TaxID=216942 RepID=A0A0K1W0V4_9MOLU|nr:hypothetical protein SLITO_v1c00690 [Spiroplasma litorale]